MGKNHQKNEIIDDFKKLKIPEEIEEEVISIFSDSDKASDKDSKNKTGKSTNGKNVPASSLAWYLEEINKIPLLNREEELECAKLAKEGDEQAKKKLILSNLRFVVSIAKRYQSSGLTLLDLINEGNLGLIKSVEKYNPNLGFHFISYAVWWIRQSIILAINQKTSLIRIPLNRSSDLRALEKMEEYLENKLGRKVTIDELAEELNLSIDDTRNLKRLKLDYLSMDAHMGDEESNTYGTTIEDTKVDSPDALLLDNDLHNTLVKALDSLSDIERSVISLRYGIENGTPGSLESIGKVLNLSKERIRQIEKKALRRLRNPSLNLNLKNYLDQD